MFDFCSFLFFYQKLKFENLQQHQTYKKILNKFLNKKFILDKRFPQSSSKWSAVNSNNQKQRSIEISHSNSKEHDKTSNENTLRRPPNPQIAPNFRQFNFPNFTQLFPQFPSIPINFGDAKASNIGDVFLSNSQNGFGLSPQFVSSTSD